MVENRIDVPSLMRKFKTNKMIKRESQELFSTLYLGLVGGIIKFVLYNPESYV